MRLFSAAAAMAVVLPLAGYAPLSQAATLDERLQQQAGQLALLQQEMAALRADESDRWQNFGFSSYGTLAYRSEEVFQNTQDQTPERREKFDVERLVVEMKYQLSSQWTLEAEVEFEHGGTGSTLEYDGFEEFGEFETELEVGGEVVVEKLQLEYRHSDQLGVRFGHIYVPVGMTTSLHKPQQYFTVSRHRSIESMIPAVWHETGVSLFGQYHNFHYQTQLVSGLNSEYFRTYNWVGGASQKRFEEVNADELAAVIRLDYGNIKQGSAIGFSYYTGKTSGNRHKTNKLDVDGQLSIFDLHGVYRQGPLTVRGQYLYGELDDTTAITQANKTTPGLGAGNFTVLGSQSEAWFIEAGVDVAPLMDLPSPLQIFASYDHSNPLKDVEQGKASQRFDIDEYALGVNYQPIEAIVLKAQISRQQVAQSAIPDTTAFELGFGYYFSL